MLDLAVAGNPRLGVERIELTLPPPSYTVRTLQALARREPGNRFTLLLGADAAEELSSWHEVEALPGLAELVVFARPGATVPRHPLIGRVIEVPSVAISARSEEHTSELQSRENLVCRLLLEKKKAREH